MAAMSSSVKDTVAGLGEAFYTHNLSRTKRAYVGLGNFRHIFGDPTFWKSLRVTLVFSLVVNPLQTALALALAVLANQRVRGIGFYRSIYLLPVVVSLNVTSTVWGLLLNRDTGLINGILANLGLPRQPFLLSADQSLWTLIGIISWVGVPYWTMFFLAGLQGIPESLFEAAAIDGANAWQTFTHVTLPLLRRVLAFVLVSDTVVNLFLFAPVWILTRGGQHPDPGYLHGLAERQRQRDGRLCLCTFRVSGQASVVRTGVVDLYDTGATDDDPAVHPHHPPGMDQHLAGPDPAGAGE